MQVRYHVNRNFIYYHFLAVSFDIEFKFLCPHLNPPRMEDGVLWVGWSCGLQTIDVYWLQEYNLKISSSYTTLPLACPLYDKSIEEWYPLWTWLIAIGIRNVHYVRGVVEGFETNCAFIMTRLELFEQFSNETHRGNFLLLLLLLLLEMFNALDIFNRLSMNRRIWMRPMIGCSCSCVQYPMSASSEECCHLTVCMCGCVYHDSHVV